MLLTTKPDYYKVDEDYSSSVDPRIAVAYLEIFLRGLNISVSQDKKSCLIHSLSCPAKQDML